jgi:fatty acid desaturase
VVGKDRDIGYSVMRMSEDQTWKPYHLGQVGINLALAAFFEYGIALYDVELEKVVQGLKPRSEVTSQLGGLWRKVRRQVLKDYVLQPLLAGPSFLPALAGTLTANLARNLWTHTIIFCGHFPEEVVTYLRQLQGSANIEGGPLLNLMSGNLSFQIEHHLFPGLPSNRYAEIAPRVRDLCERYELPYVTGPLSRQYFSMWHKLVRLSVPSRSAVPSDVPARTLPATDLAA